MKIIIEFNIEERLLALTIDNETSMVKAFKLLEVDMHTKYNKDIFHIRCAAHVINLAVQEELNYISKIDKKSNKSKKQITQYKQKYRKKRAIINQSITMDLSLTTIDNLINQEDMENPIKKLRYCINII